MPLLAAAAAVAFVAVPVGSSFTWFRFSSADTPVALDGPVAVPTTALPRPRPAASPAPVPAAAEEPSPGILFIPGEKSGSMAGKDGRRTDAVIADGDGDMLSRLGAVGYIEASGQTAGGGGKLDALRAGGQPADGWGDGQAQSGRWNRAEPPSSGEKYTDYGVAGFENPALDPLSTFSVDVDTASYVMSRRKLCEGYLPPVASVRVEEFVNYFPYEYAAPRDVPFTVDFEGAPSPWAPGHHLVRVGLQSRRVGADARKPAHFTFLVDTSGSMSSPDKLGLVKQTLTMLTEELRDGDTVAIVAYAGSAGVVLPPTPIRERQTIVRSLERLSAGGSTAMGDGIELAYQLAESVRADGAIDRVLILSDGDANVGITDHRVLSDRIRGYAERGIGLTTVGFGSGNYNDTTMERLANDGDGSYVYLDSLAEARRVFVDRLTQTVEVVAQDTKVQVEWNPAAVSGYRLVGYENRDVADADFRNDAVDAGEVGAGHQVTALYELVLLPGAASLGTVRLRYQGPGSAAPAAELDFPLPSAGLRADYGETSRDFQIAVTAGTFAEKLRQSPYVAGASWEELERRARAAARVEYPEDRELLSLIGRARSLRGD